MRKTFTYRNTRFDAAVVRSALNRFRELAGGEVQGKEYTVVHEDGGEWAYDSLDEFIADYRRFPQRTLLFEIVGSGNFSFSTDRGLSQLRVQLPDRAHIEQVFEFLDGAADASRIPAPPAVLDRVCIFIGHGRNQQWMALRDHLRDQHGFEVEAYESGARAGHTIRDILGEISSQATFALLVFTGEDQQADGQMRARQNVVHETGLFQGRLGFSKAIVLLENGVENLSNLDGIQYIPFAAGNIREAFGDVVASVRREFAA